MNVVFESPTKTGEPLSGMHFGATVRRAPDGTKLYLVASNAGSGDRVLVSLEDGSIKTVPPELRVLRVRAHVVVSGEA